MYSLIPVVNISFYLILRKMQIRKFANMLFFWTISVLGILWPLPLTFRHCD